MSQAFPNPSSFSSCSRACAVTSVKLIFITIVSRRRIPIVFESAGRQTGKSRAGCTMPRLSHTGLLQWTTGVAAFRSETKPEPALRPLSQGRMTNTSLLSNYNSELLGALFFSFLLVFSFPGLLRPARGIGFTRVDLFILRVQLLQEAVALSQTAPE